MAQDTNTLIQGAACIDRCIPDGMKMAVLIFLFAQKAGVSIDPASLIKNAACVDKCIPDGMKLSVLIQLANQIANGP